MLGPEQGQKTGSGHGKGAKDSREESGGQAQGEREKTRSETAQRLRVTGGRQSPSSHPGPPSLHPQSGLDPADALDSQRPGDLEEQWVGGLGETLVSAGTGRQPSPSREALPPPPAPRTSPLWAESLSWNPLEGTASVAPLTPGCPPQPRPSWRLSRHQASRDIPIGLYQVLLGAQAQHVQRGHGHHAGDHGEGPWLELSHSLGPSLWAGPGLPGDACTGSPSPRGTGQNEAAHPLPQDLKDSPRPYLPLLQAWARGQPSSPSQPPRPQPAAQVT